MSTKKKAPEVKPSPSHKDVALDCAEHILDTCTPDQLAEALEVFLSRIKQAVAEMERQADYLSASAKSASNHLA